MKKNIAKASFVVALIGIISKLMGTVRQSLIAYSFGQTALTDAYNSAYKIAFLSTVIINASIIMIIIPIMDKAKTEFGLKGKNRFFNNVSTVVFLFNILLSILTIIAAPLLTDIISPGFTPEIKALTTDLARIISPGVAFLGMSICLGAYQQSNFVFAPYAAVGIINNIIFYIYLISTGSNASIYGLALVTSIGSIAQLLFMIPFMKNQKVEIKPHIDLKDKYLNDAWILLLPLILTQGVAQINVFVTNALASNIQEGIVSVMDNAYRLFSAFMNLFVMTITTVIFPILSEAFNKKDFKTIKNITNEGMDFISIILIPASAGIIALASPIVQVVYQRGEFTALDTEMTKAALIGYAVGMLGNGLKVYFNRLFISFQDSVTPFKNTVFDSFMNILLAYILIIPLNFRGLALAQGVSGTLTAVLFMIFFKKKVPDIKYGSSLITIGKLIAIAIVMGFVVNRVYYVIISIIGNSNFQALIGMGVSSVIGLLIYFMGIFILRVESATRWMKAMKLKFKRN